MPLYIPSIANIYSVFITIRTDVMNTAELKRVTGRRRMLLKFCTVSSGVRFELMLSRWFYLDLVTRRMMERF